LLAQNYPTLEIVVVDDTSADDTALTARELGVKVLSTPQRSGSAGARNLGVDNAMGNVLLFVDSDVVLPVDAVFKAYNILMSRQHVCLAVGALYSTNTRHLSFVSDYKNLDLSYRGSLSTGYNKYLATYFAMLRKETFYEAGGFSSAYYTVEDIEFFYRVSKGQKNLFLCDSIFVDHLKQYTLYSMLKTNHYRISGMMKIITDSAGDNKAGEAASINYFMNIVLPNAVSAILLVGLLFNTLWPAMFLLFLFAINNMKFMQFIYLNRGFAFLLKSIVVVFIEYLVVPWSIVSSYLTIKNRI